LENEAGERHQATAKRFNDHAMSGLTLQIDAADYVHGSAGHDISE
jgi:hypothetical protein